MAERTTTMMAISPLFEQYLQYRRSSLQEATAHMNHQGISWWREFSKTSTTLLQLMFDQSDHALVTPSVSAMLRVLFEQYEQHPDDALLLEGLFPPDNHLWMRFQVPFSFSFGVECAALFLNRVADEQDIEVAKRMGQWSRADVALAKQTLLASPYSWQLDFVSRDGTRPIQHLLYFPQKPLGSRWTLSPMEVCPYGTCRVPENATSSQAQDLFWRGESIQERCPRCAAVEREVPRLFNLLYASLLGFFQEVSTSERKETTRRKQPRLDKPHKMREVEHTLSYRVLDVSRRNLTITPEDQQVLSQPKHSWIAGRPVVPLDAIDWDNPPDDSTIVLAPVPIRKHKRELRSSYFVHKQGQSVLVKGHLHPRVPLYFGAWKQRQWRFLRLIASKYEASKGEDGMIDDQMLEKLLGS